MQQFTQKSTQNTTQLNTSQVIEQFTMLLRVRYGECDAQQVVFNARYAYYIDIAMTEYFRAAVGGFQVLLNKGLDTQTYLKTPIPDWLRDRLLTAPPFTLINHAGVPA
jgi:acyl-CoA thioester hydrolase